MTMKALVTGSSGFIGQRLLEINDAAKRTVLTHSVRDGTAFPVDAADVDAVVYLSGLAHQMQKVDDQLYFIHNHKNPVAFAQAAKQHGVKHFLFVSTVKVYGDIHGDSIIGVGDISEPDDPYGESKLLAEQEILAMHSPDFCVSVVRPPLVFGPRVKGNFIRLLGLADSGYPLPFAGQKACRSMVFVDNLIHLLWHVVDTNSHGVFLAGEQQPINIETLVGTIRDALGRPRRLFRVPKMAVAVMRIAKPALVQRLFDGFHLNSQATDQVLGFSPPISFEDGIRQTLQWYQSTRQKK